MGAAATTAASSRASLTPSALISCTARPATHYASSSIYAPPGCIRCGALRCYMPIYRSSGLFGSHGVVDHLFS